MDLDIGMDPDMYVYMDPDMNLDVDMDLETEPDQIWNKSFLAFNIWKTVT